MDHTRLVYLRMRRHDSEENCLLPPEIRSYVISQSNPFDITLFWVFVPPNLRLRQTCKTGWEQMDKRLRESGGAPVFETAKPLAVVVEDNPIMAELIEQICVNLGYSVRIFVGAWSAINELYSLQPAVIITDIYMPSMSGNALLRRIAMSAPMLRDTHIAIFTAASSKECVDPVIRDLNAEVFFKPMEMSRLRKYLAKICQAA